MKMIDRKRWSSTFKRRRVDFVPWDGPPFALCGGEPDTPLHATTSTVLILLSSGEKQCIEIVSLFLIHEGEIK